MGFPIAVSSYLLFRLNGRMSKINELLDIIQIVLKDHIDAIELQVKVNAELIRKLGDKITKEK